MERPRFLPDANRLSVVAATILLAYALARFVNLPGRQVSLQFPGFYLEATFNVRTLVTLLVALLTATGADWLLSDHPVFSKKTRLGGINTVQHWLLPALTAWVIGLPLFQLPLGPLWWAGFGLGGLLLMLVLVAEYIVVDPDDLRQPAAAGGLAAVSFAIYLILAMGLRLANLRLYLIVPAVALGGGLISLRTLNLRLHGRWAFTEAAVITLILAQMAAALHYWPLSPAAYGLALLGPAYALTSLISNLSEGQPLRQALVEPGVVLAVVWVAAFWLH